MPDVIPATKLHTIDEIAQLAGVSTDYVRRAINKGEIAETRLGRAIRISQASYDDWIRRNTAKIRL